MYKVLNNLAPDYLNIFKLVESVHSYRTRSTSRNDLYIPKHSTQIFKKSFVFNGVKIWNSLLKDLRTSTSLNSFKMKCKSYFLNK